MEVVCIATATELTIDHYQRPEVKVVILRYCQDGKAIRALNGDDGWYKQANAPSKVQLTTPDDYDRLIVKYRTLYSTLDLLEAQVKDISEKWDEQKDAPEKPIGTLANCMAFTLSVDIDSINGPNGEDITTLPEIKHAVECAGQFFVDYLREHGITKSVHCLYSGGGIYCHLHHALTTAVQDWTPDNREHVFRSLTMAFNALIGAIAEVFFEVHPEHKGKVKFDQLNNQKRKFKVLFSIHKRLPFCVIPLDPDHIEIDFDKARLPLSDAVLETGSQWYQSYDLQELPELKELLRPYTEQAEKELKDRRARTGNYEIPRFPKPQPLEKWPPCMKNISQKAEPGRGPHRALAVLAAYLYQAGWPEKDAFELWELAAERAGVETRIFDCWFGQMSCPNCLTIQRESAGYPRVGLGGLGYCAPDDKCKDCLWPGDYDADASFDECKPVPTLEDMCIKIEKKIKNEDGTTEVKVEYKFDSAKASKAILACSSLKLAAWEVRAREPKTDIWTCKDGIWRRDGEFQIEKLCDDIAGSRSTRYTLDEVKRRVRNALRDGPVEFDTASPYLIGTKNGYACNLITGEVRKIAPKDYISEELQIPINYDPDANCPETFKFYDEICATDCEKLALIDFDAAALDLTPRREISERLGGGSNGKGVKQQHQRAIFGSSSMAGISLKDLNNDKFALVELFRKRILTCSETTRTDEGREYDTAILKQITGKDLLNVDEKFKKRFGMVPFCKPVIDANTAPRFNDSSPGFTSRFRRINFPYEFTDNPHEDDPRHKPLDAYVIDRITTPEELSGYLNVLLCRAQTIVKNGTSPKCKHLTEGYQEQVFSLDAFVEKFCELSPLKGVPDGFYVLAGGIYDKFDRWAKLANASTMSRTTFGMSFSKMVGSKSKPCEIDKETRRAYLGVKFDSSKYEAAIKELESKLKNQHLTTSLQPSNSKTSITNNPNNPNRFCEDNVEKYRELKERFGISIKENIPQKPVNPVIPVSDSGSAVRNPLGTCKGKSIDADLIQTDERAREKDEHFQEVAERFTSGHEEASQGHYKPELQNEVPDDVVKSESQERVATPPAGFTEEVHSKMLRAVDRLRHKRYSLMIKRNYGASLISESGLTSDRIRPWLKAAGYKPRILELSGLEVWEEGDGAEAEKADPSCGTCPVALNGDKSAIKCEPCRYLARVEVPRNPSLAVESPYQSFKDKALS